MYLSECMILTMGIYILSVIAYIFWLAPVVSSRYKYMQEFFGIPVYGAFFCIYFVLSLGIVFLMIIATLKKRERVLK